MTFNLYVSRDRFFRDRFFRDLNFFLNETSILAVSSLPPPLKLVFEKNLVFEIWTETGVMKKFSEIGGLVEKGEGGGTLRKAGGPHCFISFP